uniref:Uncharacterized protein AlNc14C37G3277 n=1 Tax=Albugo laibachii Nc14 TaxID=890382 RepID=F0W907_9STRA|nr:conserved hypothetical protein [Albugo laibachii Nc14]|eukprot:CCA17618.1 conserved hypothetical protein [Albugo laibachii Nc14]
MDHKSDTIDANGSQAILKGKKKKKNRRKSNASNSGKSTSPTEKKRSQSLYTPETDRQVLKTRSVSFCVRKHVTWGTVSAREFKRLPGGGGGIPYDGSWALGLGDPIGDVQLGSVQEMDAARQEQLQVRAKQLPKAQRHYVRQGETRQFDYCRGVRNPLFMRLCEVERKKLFNEIVKKEPLEQEKVVEARQSSRSRRSRKGKEELEPSIPEDFSYLSIEQLDEFAKIRESRDECGCSCGDLLKKVSKMNVKKLHSFLQLYQISFSSKQSKPELMALAKTVALQESNCHSSRYCECARNEVPCHDSICVGCSDSCSNPNKTYKYNRKLVDRYRKEQLAKWQERHFASREQDPAAACAS